MGDNSETAMSYLSFSSNTMLL